LNVNISFEGPDIPPLSGGNLPVFSYSKLSGSYALKWTSNAYIGTGTFFGLYFPNPQLTEVNEENGVGSPDVSKSVIWQDENQPAEQGWRIDYRTSITGTVVGMTLVVAPVKTTTVIDRAARTVASTQCGFGEIAYQVKLAMFNRAFSGINSDYGYWNWDFSSYANVACRSRVCRDVPSISLNSTETVYVPLGGPWYATRGKLGQVKVSISS
jgi:hypothetical protein